MAPPLIDPVAESEVTCILVRLDLNDGNLSGYKVLIDITAVRFRGEGDANPASEELAFDFPPRATGIALYWRNGPCAPAARSATSA